LALDGDPFSSLDSPAAFALSGWLDPGLAWILQHETIHGHPTRSPLLNRLIGAPPLSLWLPYERYRETHLRHHASEDLTAPSFDPESRYITRRAGMRGALEASLMRWNSTLLKRLTIGPAMEISIFLAREFAALARGDRRRRMIWSVHLLQVAAVVP